MIGTVLALLLAAGNPLGFRLAEAGQAPSAPLQEGRAPAARLDLAPVLAANGYTGFALVARGEALLWQTPRASCPSSPVDEIVLCHPRDPAFRRWPWASVTKQVMAVLAMQEVERGRLALDAPASRYLPALGRGGEAPTVRQLLQHRAGLRNPEDSTKDGGGQPSWYTTGPTGLPWCLQGRAAPGGDWRYNNCDTLVLGAILERVSGRSVPALFAERIATPLGLEATGFATVGEGATARGAVDAVTITPAERATLVRYGAAGGLIGPALDLLKVDRALLSGRLLGPAARAELWRGDPQLGFMALGQWSFEAPVKGCARPVRIVERRGGIGRFQVRNILLPDQNLTVILFTDREDQAFGEIWQGRGLSHDVLAAAACG